MKCGESDIYVAKTHGKERWAFEAAMSCFVAALRMTRTAFKRGRITSYLALIRVCRWKYPYGQC